MRFTTAQREAIESRHSNLLVSAAAGSGKTAVLAARIVALVREGAQVDELLVMTFTRAAAAEMRARILEELHKAAEADGDARLAAQAMAVERADIDTLHGFCAKVCREHFHAADVDPTFRVADSAEAGVLSAEAVEEALTQCYENPSPAFAFAAACYSAAQLIEIVEALHRFLMARPDPWAWLDEQIKALDVTAETLPDTPWMRALLNALQSDAEEAVAAFLRAEAYARKIGRYEVLAAKDLAYARNWVEAARHGLRTVVEMQPVDFAQKDRKPKGADDAEEERYKALREAGKDAVNRAAARRGRLLSVEGAAEDMRDRARVALCGVAEAVRLYHDLFARRKDARNLLDYSDLEHYALRAARRPEVAAALRARYRHVFIDEYQDASALQESIVRCIVRDDNLFLVGDVKQSIYRFRLAEPGLFLEKLRGFSPEQSAPNRRIALSANFRSHPAILRAVNDVFRRVFTGGPMELTYEEEAWLTPGAEADWPGADVEVRIVKRAAEAERPDSEPDAEADGDAEAQEALTQDEREAIQREAAVIAERILALRDAPEGGYAPRDIAVLMRAVRGKAPLVVQTLREHGVDAWCDIGEDALERPEARIMLSLLRAIDNMRLDVPLIAALRGPGLGLDEATLASIRNASPDGAFVDAVLLRARADDDLGRALRGFIGRMRRWAADAQTMPLDALIRGIYEETGFYAETGALPDGGARQANLRRIAEHAGAYQRAQMGGLSGFLRYVDRVKARDGIEAVDIGERDQIVRVMSIHKSKGLEFPVVFVAGMGTRFSSRNEKSWMLAHASLGIGLHAIDPALRVIRKTVAREAIELKIRAEELAEESRLLYVAMTRARKRLILVGTAKEADFARWSEATPEDVPRARSMLDWVMPCAVSAAGWDVRTCAEPPAAQREDAAQGLGDIVRAIRSLAVEPDGKVARMLEWRAERAGGMPLKQGVTAYVRAGQKPGEEPESPIPVSRLARRPTFMEAKGLTATERGDAAHIFLRAVALSATDAAEAADGMVESGLLSEEQAEALPIEKLSALLRSPLFARMRKAEAVRREWPFNLALDRGGVRTLLQGVVDCCFIEDGGWVLVDYKTDHAENPEALAEKYRSQLALYAEALERITGKPVRERLLYLIDRNATVNV